MAITPNLATGRKLSAVWGVHCAVAEDAKDLDDMVSRAGSIASVGPTATRMCERHGI